MDIATLVGLFGGLAVIGSAIALGGSAGTFANIPSLAVVVGGTFMVTLCQISLAQFLGSFKVAAGAFLHKATLAGVADRRGGRARRRGSQGGHPRAREPRGVGSLPRRRHQALHRRPLPGDRPRDALQGDQLELERQQTGIRMFKSIATARARHGHDRHADRPRQMLANMDDPKSIGPAMAVALLTTLYGAIIANAIAVPIAEKLKSISDAERLNRMLVLESVEALQSGMNPRVPVPDARDVPARGEARARRRGEGEGGGRMSAEEGPPEEEVEEGAPAWMATFADLMSLLMCFFVLLLSFSEIDLQKYKQVAGSMEAAFGVQRNIRADDIPKADSVIAQEFSPGRPEPTVIPEIRQSTTDESRPVPRAGAALPVADSAAIEELAARLKEVLGMEVEAGAVELELEDYGVRLNIRDEDAFPSGSADIQQSFVPVLDKLVGGAQRARTAR